jgi:DNA-directed RNA polymerase specialized sigma24 family protein
MTFDTGFIIKLKQRDPEACTLLVTSLTPMLEGRLRLKRCDYGSIEDICNETFYRVFRLIDGDRVRKPEHLGSFVCGVCDRVAHESRRKTCSMEPLPGSGMEPPDRQPHFDQILVDKERRALVWSEVMKLSEADRRLILELHFEGRDRREMAGERRISATGLNVRLCRALKRLRMQVLRPQPAVQSGYRVRRPATLRAQGSGQTLRAA